MFFDKISDTHYDIYWHEPKNEVEKISLWIGCFYKSCGGEWLFSTDDQSTWSAKSLQMLVDWLKSLNEEDIK